jgi:hypothetical protein
MKTMDLKVNSILLVALARMCASLLTASVSHAQVWVVESLQTRVRLCESNVT